MCEQLLANPLIESYEIELARRNERADAPARRRRRLPGLERRPRRRSSHSTRLGADAAARLAHRDRASPTGTAAVVLPGGFSYGDYLRCGAIARFSPIMGGRRFADEGGLVLGICNGFQILTEARLLPGALRPNESLSFVCRDVALQVEHASTRSSRGARRGRQLLTSPSSTATDAGSPTPTCSRSSSGRPDPLRYEPARTRTAPSPTSPASATRTGTSSA